MAVRLVDGGWWEELEAARDGDASVVRIASPFIKLGAVEGLLSEASLSLRILTRFNLDHFRDGVSDTSALRRLVELGAQVRGVQRLHAKLHLFDANHAVITSANMTEGGLRKNHELGVIAEGGALPRRCGAYFDELWKKSAPDLAVRDWTSGRSGSRLS